MESMEEEEPGPGESCVAVVWDVGLQAGGPQGATHSDHTIPRGQVEAGGRGDGKCICNYTGTELHGYLLQYF